VVIRRCVGSAQEDREEDALMKKPERDDWFGTTYKQLLIFYLEYNVSNV
jgi:hypothetical protein